VGGQVPQPGSADATHGGQGLAIGTEHHLGYAEESASVGEQDTMVWLGERIEHAVAGLGCRGDPPGRCRQQGRRDGVAGVECFAFCRELAGDGDRALLAGVAGRGGSEARSGNRGDEQDN
jgi:hypothetical protein